MDIEISFGGKKQDVDALLEELFGDALSYQGASIEIPGGARLSIGPMPMRKNYAVEHITPVVIGLVSGVGTSLIANYIWEALKKHRNKGIRTIIDRREVHFTQSGLIKIIEERIERIEGDGKPTEHRIDQPFNLQIDVPDAKHKHTAEKVMKMLDAPDVPVVIDPALIQKQKEPVPTSRKKHPKK